MQSVTPPALVFHGATVRIERVDLSFSVPQKDFGQGFYTTTSREQAESFAKNKKRRAKAANCYVNVYAYTHSIENRIFQFHKPDGDWLDFVLCNRRPLNRGGCGWPWPDGEPDIIVGPVANDSVGVTLTNLMLGIYGDPESEDARKIALSLLKTERLVDQVFFATPKAVASLTFREAIHVA